MQYFTTKITLPTDRHRMAWTWTDARRRRQMTECVLCHAQSVNKMQIIPQTHSMRVCVRVCVSHETTRKWRKLWSLTKIDCHEICQFTFYFEAVCSDCVVAMLLRPYKYFFVTLRDELISQQRIFAHNMPVWPFQPLQHSEKWQRNKKKINALNASKMVRQERSGKHRANKKVGQIVWDNNYGCKLFSLPFIHAILRLWPQTVL